MGHDSHSPCYEIDHTEVNMNEATLIGQVISSTQVFIIWKPPWNFLSTTLFGEKEFL